MSDIDNCIFCKIVAGAVPAEKTYEDEHVIAFPDIAPKSPGHTLVIPKDHYQWFYELPDETYTHLWNTVKTLTPTLLAQHGASVMKVSIVGTEVPHTHVHLIPFKKGDAPTI